MIESYPILGFDLVNDLVDLNIFCIFPPLNGLLLLAFACYVGDMLMSCIPLSH